MGQMEQYATAVRADNICDRWKNMESLVSSVLETKNLAFLHSRRVGAFVRSCSSTAIPDTIPQNRRGVVLLRGILLLLLSTSRVNQDMASHDMVLP